jgi:hypothetical protein
VRAKSWSLQTNHINEHCFSKPYVCVQFSNQLCAAAAALYLQNAALKESLMQQKQDGHQAMAVLQKQVSTTKAAAACFEPQRCACQYVC